MPRVQLPLDAFQPWVPRSWRLAYDPELVDLWGPRPDPTLPRYWSGGLCVRKLHYIGAIGAPGGRRIPWDELQTFLPLMLIRRVPMQGSVRYVTECPACGRDAPFLIEVRDRPYCRRCRPERAPPLVSLLALLNAEAQLAPVQNPSDARSLLLGAIGAALRRPALSALLPTLLTPTQPPPPTPYRIRLTVPHPQAPWLLQRRAWKACGAMDFRRRQLVRAAQALAPTHAWNVIGSPGVTGSLDVARLRGVVGLHEPARTDGSVPGEAEV